MLVAGPNLTIDRTSTLYELRPGEVLRVADVVVTPGGKGLNVARAAGILGASACLVGFLPGHTGRAAGALIAEEGVTFRGVATPGEIRSTSIVLERSGRATVINEPGPAIDAERWVALEAVIDDLLADHDVLVCSGSLPPGAPDDGYARLTARARDAGRRVVVDAGGAILAATLKAGPDVVTPNLAEAEGVLHGRSDHAVEASPDARPRALEAARQLVQRGAGAAIVTAAAAGAAVVWHGEPVWIRAPHAPTVNPIGAGDVFTAALAAALERGASLLTAAHEGIAAASASVEHPTGGHFDPHRMREHLARMARHGPKGV
jgi:1-phosphofructokinase family hexose kinase